MAQVRPGTQRCPRCGREISAMARFCVNCGARMTAPAPPSVPAAATYCPSCGAPLPPGARFCPSCSAPVAAATPRQAAGAPPRQPQAAPQAPARARPAPAPTEMGGSAAGKIILYLLLWLVVWMAIAAAIYIFASPDPKELLLGIGAASLLSLVLMLKTLGEKWEGEIVEIRTERVRVADDDDDSPMTHWEDQDFAYIRQKNGRVRKMRAMPQWRVGNYLVKRRGETTIHVL